MTDHMQSRTAPGVEAPSARRRVAKAVAVVMAVVVVVTLVALGVGALSGSSSDSMSASRGATAASDKDAVLADSSGARSADAVAGDSAAGEPAAVSVVDRAVIRTGAMSLTTNDVEAARRELLAVTDQFGGYVEDEQSRADRDGRLRSADLTLQVPTDDLDTAMERIGAAGTVVARSQSARDVTREVVDVDSRVASARASLQRVRLLLNRATSLGDVINLEQVLSSRQAELEALLAQQESLAARTSMAVLRVDVSLPAAATPDEPQQASGFLAGLARGWHALGTGYLALATLVGAVLPTAVVLGLLALAGRFAVRRIRSSRTAAPSVRSEPGPG